MPSAGETRFTHAALVVRDDDEDGRYGQDFADIHAPFTLDAIHRQSASVIFRLNLPITDSIPTQSIVTLLITPDRIDSLRTTICDTSATDHADKAVNPSPPSFGLARGRLGGVRLARHLQFRLHGGLHPQLVVPAGFTLEHEHASSQARRLFAFATWLATASTLSVYMPHNALPRAKLDMFNEAVRQFPTLTVAQRQAFERTVDLRRWYNGKGGVVFPIELQDKPSTPARTETDAATIAVDTPPGYKDSPPQYNHPSEGHVSSSFDGEAGGDLGPILAGDDAGTSPAADTGPPPEYNTSQRHHTLPPATKRPLHCGSEDVDLSRLSKKRIAKPESSSRSGTMGLANLEGRAQLLLERQQHLIQALQEEVNALKRQNKQLDGRQDALEGCQNVLEERQDALEESQDDLQTSLSETNDKVDSLLVHASELEDDCEALKSQLPDVGIEMEDWLAAHMDDRVNDGIEEWLCENLSDTIQDYIEKQVAAHMADVRARVRSALFD